MFSFRCCAGPRLDLQADICCAAVRAPPASGAGNQKAASAPAAAVRGCSPSSAPVEEVREAAGGSNAAVDSRRGARDGAGATVELMVYTKRTAAPANRSCTSRGGERIGRRRTRPSRRRSTTQGRRRRLRASWRGRRAPPSRGADSVRRRRAAHRGECLIHSHSLECVEFFASQVHTVCASA